MNLTRTALETAEFYGEQLSAPPPLAIAACTAALATLVPVLLHQTGALNHLPDPPGDIFDSDRITESRSAHPLGIPDAVLGLASYSVTLALLLAARTQPKARPVLALKLLGDGALASFNVVRQLTGFGKICSWCTGTALATAVMLMASHKVLVSAGKVARP
jgi:uncharacterized membrane protein